MHRNEIEVSTPFRFHCPMTGVLVAGPGPADRSPATAFLLRPGSEEFDYLAPALEPIWREVWAAHAGDDRSTRGCLDAFCRRLEGHDHLVLFSLSARGGKCGEAGSTLHVCIDFDDREHEGPGGTWDAGDAGDVDPASGEDTAAAVVPLPRHVPLAALDLLLAAYRHVARDASGEPDLGPIDLLVGYRDLASGEGFMAFEVDDGQGISPCASPLERLRAGETLAIQLHDGWLADGVELIDGSPYRPTVRERRAAEAIGQSADPRDPRALPDDTGFYAIGVGLDGDRLTIEPIAVDCGLQGESLVRAAVFPESLRRRIAAFLARLA